MFLYKGSTPREVQRSVPSIAELSPKIRIVVSEEWSLPLEDHGKSDIFRSPLQVSSGSPINGGPTTGINDFVGGISQTKSNNNVEVKDVCGNNSGNNNGNNNSGNNSGSRKLKTTTQKYCPWVSWCVFVCYANAFFMLSDY